MAKRKYVRRKYGRRRKRTKRGGGNRTATVVRKTIMRMSETKFSSLAVENVNLYHNTGQAIGPVIIGNLLRTNIGDGQNQRNGDSVFGKYVKIQIWISNKLDRPNVMYRVFVIASPPDQANTANPASLWKNFSGNRMIDHINSDYYNILYDRRFAVQGNNAYPVPATGHEKSKYLSIYLPLNRKFHYQTDTSGAIPSAQRNCLSLAIVPYDSFGTLTTDNICSCAVQSLFCFKDF